VLFTGDAAARGQDGKVICGVFNVNRDQAAASFRRPASMWQSRVSDTASRSPATPQPPYSPLPGTCPPTPTGLSAKHPGTGSDW
jgi:hypothetical protein